MKTLDSKGNKSKKQPKKKLIMKEGENTLANEKN